MDTVNLIDDIYTFTEPSQCQSKGCPHSQIYQGLCVLCGSSVDLDSSSETVMTEVDWSFAGSSLAGFWASPDFVKEVAREDESRLLRHRRLRLVLDLDETLIHTKIATTPSGFPMDHPLFGFCFELESYYYFVYLRPGLQNFLRACSLRFELYLYSNGTQAYVQEVLTRLLGDPSSVFSGVIARTDVHASTLKTLSKIVASNETTLIIDDRTDVWDQKDVQNLLQVDPFSFDPLSSGESACVDSALSDVDYLLTSIHEAFFDHGFDDVRHITVALGEADDLSMDIILEDSSDQD